MELHVHVSASTPQVAKKASNSKHDTFRNRHRSNGKKTTFNHSRNKSKTRTDIENSTEKTDLFEKKSFEKKPFEKKQWPEKSEINSKRPKTVSMNNDKNEQNPSQTEKESTLNKTNQKKNMKSELISQTKTKNDTTNINNGNNNNNNNKATNKNGSAAEDNEKDIKEKLNVDKNKINLLKNATEHNTETKATQKSTSTTSTSTSTSIETFATTTSKDTNIEENVLQKKGSRKKRPKDSDIQHVDFENNEYHMSISKLSENSNINPIKSKKSEHIFVKNNDFINFNIHEKLISILKLEKEKGGFGLKNPTYVQRISVHALSQGKSAFIKSQTGSGKTLAFLIPIVHRLVSINPQPNRSDGTLGVIIAPTRELCSQIYEVLVLLLKPFIWLVPGLISGGERKKSEKGRIRKGISILVATPGRLLDHLQSTESFKIDKLKVFILDEVDRLLDMGFDKQISEIMKFLLGTTTTHQIKTSSAIHSSSSNHNSSNNSSSHQLMNMISSTKSQVQTILSSATSTPSVQKLLQEYVSSYDYFDADENNKNHNQNQNNQNNENDEDDDGTTKKKKSNNNDEFSSTYDIPQQLSQHSMVVTYKLRLPALCATLKHCYNKNVKVIVFVSTTSSADFLTQLFKQAPWPTNTTTNTNTYQGTTDSGGNGVAHGNVNESLVSSKQVPSSSYSEDTCTFYPKWPCYRLHGDVPQKERILTVKKFSKESKGLLICTDVASRGLDLPNIDWIIQYDAPCEISDYVHRIGRTARKGQHGSSLLFLSPNESGFLDILEKKKLKLISLSLEATFERAFDLSKFKLNQSKLKHQNESTSSTSSLSSIRNNNNTNNNIITPIILQEHLEEEVDKSDILKKLASSAYQSFIRAYSIHASEIKSFFQIRALHIGHVARSFALRHAPTEIKQMAPKRKANKKAVEKEDVPLIEEKPYNKKKKIRSGESLLDI